MRDSILRIPIAAGLLLLFWGCGTSSPDDPLPAALPPTSTCTTLCDAATPGVPVMTEDGGYGGVTTYGSVSDPQPSAGGACNYGPTEILLFAAAHVDVQPGDNHGLWDGGRICGQCVEVRTASPDGWRSVVVRLLDKCPDGYCGIDLGGAPAQTLMGSQPGRYSGEWNYVSCTGQTGVSDGEPVLHVKDGANAWWSLVQVRNGPGATTRMQYQRSATEPTTDFAWATEAEGYWKVPDGLMSESSTITVTASFSDGTTLRANFPATALARADTSIALIP